LNTAHKGTAPDRRRSAERLRHHYDVERALADRLRSASSRPERARIYETMYDTLFAEVPDHPRLVLRETPDEVARRNHRKLRLLAPFLTPGSRVLEIGAGDCSFGVELAPRVRFVCGVEISAQGARLDNAPRNFALVLYDGFEFPFAARSFDLAFSDQLLEHLHPDDAELHFRAVACALVPGGTYLLRTPHRFTGPHDVSRYFTRGDAEGFHLKEWTYRELHTALRACGYPRVTAIWSARGVSAQLPIRWVCALETVLGVLPRALRRSLSRLPLPGIVVAARTPR
jgi:SAM-dependent methyltransferase